MESQGCVERAAKEIEREFAEQAGEKQQVHHFHAKTDEEITSFSTQAFARAIKIFMPLTYQLISILSGLPDGNEFQNVISSTLGFETFNGNLPSQ